MTPRRIVSLVPSLTEALFALGLGERVVGVTEWCVHPADGVAPLPKIGGTKNPDIDSILDLTMRELETPSRNSYAVPSKSGKSQW